MNRCALTIRMLMILRARGTKYPVSTRVLAQELETNPRNIREFKKELVTAGFNIIEKKGPYGGYMLDEEQLMPVTRLTEEEMAALEEGISFMKGHPEVSFYPAYRSAMDKVLDVSHQKVPISIRYLESPGEKLSVKLQRMLDLAMEAILQHRILQLEYQGTKNETCLSFELDPYDVIHYRNTYYLVGFSHLRKEYRVYRFSEKRMRSLRKTKDTFLWDSQYQLMSIISRFGIVKKDFKRVKVQVQNDQVDRFEEYKGWGVDMKKKAETAQSTIYSFKSPDRYELYRQIFSFEGKVKLIEPESYREEFMSKIRTFLETGEPYDDSCQ